jgi:hypothetical protein
MLGTVISSVTLRGVGCLLLIRPEQVAPANPLLEPASLQEAVTRRYKETLSQLTLLHLYSMQTMETRYIFNHKS